MRSNRISSETKQLRNRRYNDRSKHNVEYVELGKLIRRKVKEGHANYQMERFLKTTEER